MDINSTFVVVFLDKHIIVLQKEDQTFENSRNPVWSIKRNTLHLTIRDQKELKWKLIIPTYLVCFVYPEKIPSTSSKYMYYVFHL